MSKNPAAVALGRLGGLKGGHAKAATMSPEERRSEMRAIASMGGKARAAGMTALERSRAARHAVRAREEKRRARLKEQLA